MRDLKDSKLSLNLPGSILTESIQLGSDASDSAFHKLLEGMLKIYIDADTADENTLDHMAVEMHADFYDRSFDISIKRQLVKDAYLYKCYKGTPFAVERLIKTVYGEGEVKEWFEYEGEPYHFRVYTRNRTEVEENRETFMKAIGSVKNLRSFLDDIIIEYNSHKELSRFTHAELAAYTHFQLREEILTSSNEPSTPPTPTLPSLLDENLITNKTFVDTTNWVGVYTSDVVAIDGNLRVTGNNATSIRAYNDDTDMTGAQDQDVYFMMLHVKPTNGTPSEISLKYRANGDGDRTLKSTSNITLGQVHELYGMAALEAGMPGMDRVAIYNTYPSGADHIYYIMGYDALADPKYVPLCINLSKYDRENETTYAATKTDDEIASMIHEELNTQRESSLLSYPTIPIPAFEETCSASQAANILSWQYQDNDFCGNGDGTDLYSDWRSDGGWSTNKEDVIISRQWNSSESKAAYAANSMSGDINKTPQGYLDDSSSQRYLQLLMVAYKNDASNTALRDAIIKGIKFILRCQYTGDTTVGDYSGQPIDLGSASGGFGSVMPREDGADGNADAMHYQNRITYSDDVTAEVMMLWTRIINEVHPFDASTALTNLKSVYTDLISDVTASYNACLNCIIDSQIINQSGHKTGWGGWHDIYDLSPAPGRLFEPSDYCDMRAHYGIVELLLTISNRSTAVKSCLDGAITFLKASARLDAVYIYPLNSSKDCFVTSSGNQVWPRFTHPDTYTGVYSTGSGAFLTMPNVNQPFTIDPRSSYGWGTDKCEPYMTLHKS
ncbi:phage tail protein I [Vallitaleaceae bacterium 9-2]